MKSSGVTSIAVTLRLRLDFASSRTWCLVWTAAPESTSLSSLMVETGRDARETLQSKTEIKTKTTLLKVIRKNYWKFQASCYTKIFCKNYLLCKFIAQIVSVIIIVF